MTRLQSSKRTVGCYRVTHASLAHVFVFDEIVVASRCSQSTRTGY